MAGGYIPVQKNYTRRVKMTIIVEDVFIPKESAAVVVVDSILVNGRKHRTYVKTEAILEAVKQANGNRCAAARALNVTQSTVYTRLKKLTPTVENPNERWSKQIY